MGTEENFDDSFLHIFQALAGEDNAGAHTCEPGSVDAAGPTPPAAPKVDVLPNCFHETAPFDHNSLLPDPAKLVPAYDAAMAGHGDNNDVNFGVSGGSLSSPSLSVGMSSLHTPLLTPRRFACRPGPVPHQGYITAQATTHVHEHYSAVSNGNEGGGLDLDGVSALGDDRTEVVVDRIIQLLPQHRIHIMVEDPETGYRKEVGGHEVAWVFEKAIRGAAMASDHRGSAPFCESPGPHPAMAVGGSPPETPAVASAEIRPRDTDFLFGPGGTAPRRLLGSLPFWYPHSCLLIATVIQRQQTNIWVTKPSEISSNGRETSIVVCRRARRGRMLKR
jgi:hypothetical protein